MATIHELSPIVALPRFDIFGVTGTQLIVDSDIQTEQRPISSITDSISPIEFEIHTGLDEYVDLSRSELYLCLKVKLKKTNLAKDQAMTADDWKLISPINYILNTMFKQIRVSIGQSVVTTASLNYAYVAYIDALLNYSNEVKRSHLQTAFWHRDDTSNMDDVNEDRSKRIRPSGASLEEGRELELYGNLHLDLASQIRPILGGVSINVTLLPNDPKFHLIYDKFLQPEVQIKDARLYVHRSKLTPNVVLAHNKGLDVANARYFICRKEVKSFIIQKGTLDCYLNNVENGILPRKIFVRLVSNEAYNGHSEQNPFNFKNYSLRHIACYLDGCQYPQRLFTPDFVSKKYMREYFGLFEASNQVRYNTNIDITREEYYSGFTLYGFNFSPDLSEGCTYSEYVSEIKRGNLRIELRLNINLNETVTAIVFCEYDNTIEIPKSRIAIKDFQ